MCLVEGDNAVGVAVGQRLEKDGVSPLKTTVFAADSECEHQRAYRAESRAGQQGAKSSSHIVTRLATAQDSEAD
jgi:hypothetical protein